MDRGLDRRAPSTGDAHVDTPTQVEIASQADIAETIEVHDEDPLVHGGDLGGTPHQVTQAELDQSATFTSSAASDDAAADTGPAARAQKAGRLPRHGQRRQRVFLYNEVFITVLDVTSTRRVIPLFGGQSAMAVALGTRQSTVGYWARTDRIPATWRGQILAVKYWGHLVNELIHNHLDGDVPDWLRTSAPKPRHGQNYHQWLTGQYGSKKLMEHIWLMIGTAPTCQSMHELRYRMAMRYGKQPFQMMMLDPRDRVDEAFRCSTYPPRTSASSSRRPSGGA